MKYLNKLTDDEIIELMQPYIKHGFRQVVSIDRFNDCIELYVEIEIEDDEYKDGTIILEDGYSLMDYDVRIYNYQNNNAKEDLKKYRKWLLNRFGNQYALDYLLDI